MAGPGVRGWDPPIYESIGPSANLYKYTCVCAVWAPLRRVKNIQVQTLHEEKYPAQTFHYHFGHFWGTWAASAARHFPQRLLSLIPYAD
jgi:hypothetical protein